MRMSQNFPRGIPIETHVHSQYSDELKEAWETFHAWWQQVDMESEGGPVSHANMTEEVRQAYELILETPIPGFDDVTGADSCYMIGVAQRLTD